MKEGILIEPIINKKEHGDAIQAEAFSFALKIINTQRVPSNEFNIFQIVMRSAEGQNIVEDFDKKKFFVEKLNPEESKIIELGKCGSYMYGIVSVHARIESINKSSFDVLQKNPFTEEIIVIGKNKWVDFFRIRNSNEYRQERITNWIMYLTIAIGLLALIQCMSIIFIEPWQEKESIRAQIHEVDGLNFFVASQIKFIFEKENEVFLVNYETQIYKENFDMLNKQTESTGQAIRGNIILMDASNKMMNLLLEQPEKQSEYSPKLISNAEEIIKNLDVYNELKLKTMEINSTETH